MADFKFASGSLFIDVDVRKPSGAVICVNRFAEQPVRGLELCLQNLASIVVGVGRSKNGSVRVVAFGLTDLAVGAESDLHLLFARLPLFVGGIPFGPLGPERFYGTVNI